MIKVREKSAPTKSATPQHGSSLLSLLCSLSTLLMGSQMAIAEEQNVPCVAPPSLFSFVHWFDPFLLGYNVLLFFFAVLAVPGITYFYIKSMKTVKHQRVKNDLTEAQWAANGAMIKKILDYDFSARNYRGSVLSLMTITAFGASILLLLKPIPNVTAGCGVDYSKGANLLLLGPYIELFAEHQDQFYHHVIVSLTAFQFGFLGAYVYMVSDLLRSYFTLGLSPHTFVANTIRMVTASLLSLVVSFLFSHLSQNLSVLTPLMSFFFGYFPETALLYMRKWMAARFHITTERYFATPLASLPGVSYEHISRLTREGYDNVENLANAIPLELALRTGFSYHQLRQWVAQAWLRTHLGSDYVPFMRDTGITSADELIDYLVQQAPAGADQPKDPLKTATKPDLYDKLQIVSGLARLWRQAVDEWAFRE